MKIISCVYYFGVDVAALLCGAAVHEPRRTVSCSWRESERAPQPQKWHKKNQRKKPGDKNGPVKMCVGCAQVPPRSVLVHGAAPPHLHKFFSKSSNCAMISRCVYGVNQFYVNVPPVYPLGDCCTKWLGVDLSLCFAPSTSSGPPLTRHRSARVSQLSGYCHHHRRRPLDTERTNNVIFISCPAH